MKKLLVSGVCVFLLALIGFSGEIYAQDESSEDIPEGMTEEEFESLKQQYETEPPEGSSGAGTLDMFGEEEADTGSTESESTVVDPSVGEVYPEDETVEPVLISAEDDDVEEEELSVNPLFWVILIVVGIGGTAFWLLMIADALRREEKSYPEGAPKILWLVVVTLLWVIGAAAYYLMVFSKKAVGQEKQDKPEPKQPSPAKKTEAQEPAKPEENSTSQPAQASAPQPKRRE